MGYDVYWDDVALAVVPPLSPDEVRACRDRAVAFGPDLECCGWVVSDDGSEITPSGTWGNPIAWLRTIWDMVLSPGGHSLVGRVDWKGDDDLDCGRVLCEPGKPPRVFDARWRAKLVERGEPDDGEGYVQVGDTCLESLEAK